MTFTLERQERVCEEANAVVGSQWELNGRWVFSSLAEVMAFIEARFGK